MPITYNVNMKKIIALAFIGTLVGCTTTPRTPQLPQATQEAVTSAAQYAVGVVDCYEAGHLTSDATAQAQQNISTLMSRFSYDRAHYEQSVSYYQSNKTNIGALSCSQLVLHLQSLEDGVQQAIAQQRVQQQTQRLQSDRAWERTLNQPFFRSPTHTVCNNTAGQVICNSY